MLTLADIKITINNIIKKRLGKPVFSNKTKDAFNPPAFFTRVEDLHHSFKTKNLEDREVYAIIEYFPSDEETDLDLVKLGDELRYLFGRSLDVGGQRLEILESKMEVFESVLQFRMQIRSIRTNLNQKKYEEQFELVNEVIEEIKGE